MTSEHVSSFVTDLVEMAKAMERVPQLEQELRATERLNSGLIDEVTEAKVALEASRRYAAGLEQRLHDAEVAVTAAELRFLECDDAKGTLVRVLEGVIREAQGVLQAVTPEPVSVPVDPTPENADGPTVTASSPRTASETEATPSPFDSPDATPHSDASSDDGTAEGQSEHPLPPSAEVSPQPTSCSSETPTTTPSTSQEHGEGLASEGVSVPSDPTLASTNADEADGPTSAEKTATPTPDASSPSGPYTEERYDDSYWPKF